MFGRTRREERRKRREEKNAPVVNSDGTVTPPPRRRGRLRERIQALVAKVKTGLLVVAGIGVLIGIAYFFAKSKGWL